MWNLQRQGRLTTVAPLAGQEAAVVGVVRGLELATDWLVPYYRDATGYGALGYGPPAAVGAAVAAPDAPVVCLVGDGGFQFSLAEIGSAADIGARVIFLVWNNDGYQEIENYMVECGITPEGVRPSAPDFLKVAEAYGLPAERLESVADLSGSLKAAAALGGPSLIEIHQTKTRGATA